MKPDDILQEVLSDPSIKQKLHINEEDILSAKMNVKSKDSNIEVIKSIILGGFDGQSSQNTFNEIKRIKKL